MKIFLLALEGVFDTGLAVMLDAFSIANRIAANQMEGAFSFDVAMVGVRKRVRSGHGLIVPVEGIKPRLKPDWVIVPALNGVTPEQLIRNLDRADVVEAQTHLRKWHAKGAGIASSCTGAFILAEAGLVDGGEATTTWWLSPLFRKRYPQVSLDESRMLVSSGRIVTTGASMGHLDLALWIIRKASPKLTAIVSRYMLADIRSSQAAYIIPSHLAQADPLIQRFEHWSREHLKTGFSLGEAAKGLATSSRTLQRRCNEVLGKSPLSYFQDLRVERAKSLIQGGERNIETIASEVGYLDGATLRTLLRERLGRGVRELRADIR
jgi:transcriptional regulator GlxA family with amidase domain